MEWSEVNEGFVCEFKVVINFNDVVDVCSRYFGVIWVYVIIVLYLLVCFFLCEKLNFGVKKMLMWCFCIFSLWEFKFCL